MKNGEVLVFFTGISLAIAHSVNRFDENSGNKEELTNLVENRKHKPYHDLFLFGRKSGFSTVYVNPLHGIAFMGGLQSLVTFIVIKIKIVLVVVTIIGFIAFAFKLFGLLKYTGYFYKNDYPPFVSSNAEISNYGNPPFLPYSSSPHDHEISNNDWPSYSEHYAKSMNDFNEQFPSINMTEIMYSFMNVDKEDCRARLICELETILLRSPFLKYLTRHGATINEVSGTKNNIEDCTAHYTKCYRTTKRLTRRGKRHAITRQYLTDYPQIIM